jgi:hypothetical protein
MKDSFETIGDVLIPFFFKEEYSDINSIYYNLWNSGNEADIALYEEENEEKSVSASTTCSRDLFTRDDVITVFRELAVTSIRLIAVNADSTLDTLPVIIRVPVNLSTKPMSAPEDLIAMSAVITALSAGETVRTPIALLE